MFFWVDGISDPQGRLTAFRYTSVPSSEKSTQGGSGADRGSSSCGCRKCKVTRMTAFRIRSERLHRWTIQSVFHFPMLQTPTRSIDALRKFRFQTPNIGDIPEKVTPEKPRKSPDRRCRAVYFGRFRPWAEYLLYPAFKYFLPKSPFSSGKILSDAGFVEGIKIGVRLRTELTKE